MFAKIKLFFIGLFGIFAWKAGKDHADNKANEKVIKNVEKANSARRDPVKRERVRNKYKR